MDEVIAIRIVDHKHPLARDSSGVLYLEDIKLARLTVGDTWMIEGPHPLYDYSPLSYMDFLTPGAKVSHWSPLRDGELENWHGRFGITGDMTYMRLECDDVHRETVYRTLAHAGLMMQISMQNTKNEEERHKLEIMMHTLYNMQSVMDLGGVYEKKDEGDHHVTTTESE
ncbi:MAG: hypothetical protein NC131_11155 [Roseburia sp.]|nr:hypothetical protein [Roseburia sp.]